MENVILFKDNTEKNCYHKTWNIPFFADNISENGIDYFIKQNLPF